LSPSSPSSFLGVGVGVCNSFGLVPKFLDGKALSKMFVCFNFSLFRSWCECRDHGR
jgi:hypothetical protein